MNSRVFVVNEPMVYEDGEWRRALNLAPARDWGRLEHVLPAGQLPDNPQALADQVRCRMEALAFGRGDYLMLVGDPRALAAAAVEAARRCGGRLRLLHWQRRQQRYDPVEMDLAGQDDDGCDAKEKVTC